MSQKKGTILYFSHGGGPLPILGDPGHKAMVEFMKKLPGSLDKPDSVLVISAHWEEQNPTVMTHPSPSLFYDYYGFPDEAYTLEYPAPGHPELADKVSALLEKAGFSAGKDPERGFDHGLFIPMKMMYPSADIPMTQLSLKRGLDPEEHIALGKALSPLLQENILIVGSGFSFHNMQAFFRSSGKDPANDTFQDWLVDVCTGSYSAEERNQHLISWEDAPNARYCHPREEHLLPLMTCQGAAGTGAELVFDDLIFGKRAVAFKW